MRLSEHAAGERDVAVYSAEDRRALHGVAFASIEHGLRTGVALEPDPSVYAESLQRVRACFVTLRTQATGELRGCVGGLEATRPLVCAVAHSAFSAAFRDPRFQPLRADELPGVEVHVSVLSPLEAIEVESERELCERLRIGIDGLVLADGRHSATFLPDVWQSLQEPDRFVRELKKKAGLPAEHWSRSMRVQLYTSESF
jgi:AmmeMemoRadiSam system protein A